MEEKDIHWKDGAIGTRLDMEYYDELQSVVSFIRIYCVVLGLVVIASAISPLAKLLAIAYWVNQLSMLGGDAYVVSAITHFVQFLPIAYWVNLISAIGWCAYTASAITHRKPNAVFHARAMLIVSLLNNVCSLSMSFSILGLVLVLVNAFCLYRVFVSSDLSEVFHAEFRRHSFQDWLVVALLFLAPIVIYVICSLWAFLN